MTCWRITTNGPDATYRMTAAQTTAYTELIEVAKPPAHRGTAHRLGGGQRRRIQVSATVLLPVEIEAV
ncbi:MAG: hypothetical protein U0350_42485 [Caldilineaceae bacterium]